MDGGKEHVGAAWHGSERKLIHEGWRKRMMKNKSQEGFIYILFVKVLSTISMVQIIIESEH